MKNKWTSAEPENQTKITNTVPPDFLSSPIQHLDCNHFRHSMKCSVLWHLFDKCDHFCLYLIIYLDIHLYLISSSPLCGLVYLQPKSRNNNIMFGRGRGRGGKPAENTGFIVRSVCVCARMCVCVCVHVYSRQGGWDERGVLFAYDWICVNVSCDPNAILGEYKHCCRLWLFIWGHTVRDIQWGLVKVKSLTIIHIPQHLYTQLIA